MNTSGDAAEQIVRFSLEGLEVVAKISGEGAKNVLALLVSIMKDKQQTKGKTRLNNMLKTGKELKIFSVKKEDLQKFSQEAKRYGVLYCALIDKQNKNYDGMVDIMVRAEDASKINRIVERFKIATVDAAKIKTEIQKTREQKNSQEPMDKGVVEKDINTRIKEEIDKKPIAREENYNQNPYVAKTEKSPLSEQSLKQLNKSEGVSKSVEKKSVRKELSEIKEQMKEELDLSQKDVAKSKTSQNKNQKKKVKSKKNKTR